MNKNSMLQNYTGGLVRGLGIFLILVIMISLSKALDITTNVQQKVTYIKKMYFTSDGVSPDDTFSNVNITIDGENGSIVTSGAVNINPGKLKNNTILSEDIKNLTIKSNNIGNSAIIGTKIVADSITNTKIANLGVKTQDIKDNSLGAVHLDSKIDYTFQKLIDADNENYYVDPVGASSVNRVEGNSLYTDKAMKISTKLGIGKDPVEELDVNGGIKGTGQVCGKYSGIYGTINEYCIGDKPLEIGTLQTNKWCKVSGNKINCTYDVPFTFSWKIGAYGSCSSNCGSGMQTRTVVCERSDDKIVGDSYCTGTKPVSSQSCNNFAGCSYTWKVNSWGACNAGSSYWGSRGGCSKTCGGGTQTRSCVLPTGIQTRTIYCLRSDGTTVSNSLCSGTQPATTLSCSATLAGCGGVSSQSKSCNTQSCCTPNVGKVCSGGHVYQVDSCGVAGSKLQNCTNGCSTYGGWPAKEGGTEPHCISKCNTDWLTRNICTNHSGAFYSQGNGSNFYTWASSDADCQAKCQLAGATCCNNRVANPNNSVSNCWGSLSSRWYSNGSGDNRDKSVNCSK